MDTPKVTIKDYAGILISLRDRPSRASAAAIGHGFVLNGAPGAFRIRGLDALTGMMCDWAVAIFDEAITGAKQPVHVRRHGIGILHRLVSEAIAKGYRGAQLEEVQCLYHDALTFTRGCGDAAKSVSRQAVEDLCNHLSQAVADGCFGRLPDF